jgi:2-haloacid dehalogenase
LTRWKGSIPDRDNYLRQTFHYSDDFHGGLLASDVGVRKPDKRMYQAIAAKASCKPKEIVYVDDEEKNLPPAREMGMQTLLFTSPGKLKADMAELGVSLPTS